MVPVRLAKRKRDIPMTIWLRFLEYIVGYCTIQEERIREFQLNVFAENKRYVLVIDLVEVFRFDFGK